MFTEKTLEILRRYVAERYSGVTLHASKALGLPNDTLNRWIKGERDPGLSKIGPVMDKILWEYASPEKIDKIEVKFPALVPNDDVSQEEIDELKKKLETAKEKIKEQEEELAGLRRIEKKYDELIDKMMLKQPEEPRQNKSCA